MIARKGNKVRVHYTGTLKDGEIFDSSSGREPLEFVVGSGQMIPGFDRGVEGMSVGEERTVTLPPPEAYGERDEGRVFRVGRKSLPDGYEPSLGDALLMSGGGSSMKVTVCGIDEDHVFLDGNHPLAGKELIFLIRLVEVGN